MISEKLNLLENQVRELNKRLADTEAYKGHFLSNIRNAMTNPFTSIVGLSEEIIRTDKEAWKKVIMLASLIHGEAFSLDFQLKNIFCAAELESGELTPEAINTDVKSLAGKVIEKYQIKIKRKNINVRLGFDIPVHDQRVSHFITDPGFIELIIVNLIDNAVKFTGQDGNIHLNIRQQNELLTIILKDDGKGINDNGKALIFDRFKRLESNINSIESGHGLGLSIIKVLIELLNGSLDVNSQAGEGSTFTVIIPEIIAEGIESYSSQGNEYLFIEDKVY